MIVRCIAAKQAENYPMRSVTVALMTVGLFAPCVQEASAQARLSPEDCRRVTAHVPDRSVAFQPGVGAGGRRVAPADLSPPQQIVPPTPTFTLGVDLQRRYGLPRDINADLPIGIVTVEGNRLFLNGRPLGPEDQSSLAAACAAARGR
jgi:hypothetical protein